MRQKICAMIPARIGSQRLKYKNLALINKKPMIYYAIKAAKASRSFDKIFINSDHEIFSKIATRYKVGFYKRVRKLGGSNIKSDSVVYDFFKNNSGIDILAWVNSTTPFQTSFEIKKIVSFFSRKNFDSLITVENKKAHCNYNKKPLNYSKKSNFSKTQDLKEVQTFAYSLMMWKRKAFLKQYEKNKNAILCGKTYFYPVRNLSAIIIKKIEDLELANYIMQSNSKKFTLKYDKIIKLKKFFNGKKNKS